LNDENIHYLVEKLENLDVNNIDVDTVNDVVLNCNSIITWSLSTCTTLTSLDRVLSGSTVTDVSKFMTIGQ
jgi:hypothetical protein